MLYFSYFNPLHIFSTIYIKDQYNNHFVLINFIIYKVKIKIVSTKTFLLQSIRIKGLHPEIIFDKIVLNLIICYL
ncbi:hypothetical protein DWU89_18875 [Parabacteroides acidifaciens]|uniref:Uncharacterized protein n=1 Tax=Parabacteroides acidifaciens TaxID=2290935 RepID=A0A3D8H9A7_9BACT|nr:hypothetical protein DWU89_18875 [Parabacteroides acidifaciens]